METGPLSIDILINAQQLVVYRGGMEIARSLISAGREGHDTPAGNYKILQKEIDHKSNLYGFFVDKQTDQVVKGDVSFKDTPPPGTFFAGASMPYYERLTYEGVGLHAGYLPGYNASHGCIRLPTDFARLLYGITQIGTPVRVVK